MYYSSLCLSNIASAVKTCVKQPLSNRPKLVFQLLLKAGPKYCRMLKRDHSEILFTFIKLPFVIKIFVLPIYEWPLYTNFVWSRFGCTREEKLITLHEVCAFPYECVSFTVFDVPS